MAVTTKTLDYKSKHLNKLLPYLIVLAIVMQIAYVILYWLYDNNLTHRFLGLPPVLDEASCSADNSNEKCGKPELFAFQIVCGSVFVVIGGWSFWDWHMVQRSSNQTTAVQRLYGHDSAAQWVTVLNLAFQVWDFLISLTIPELCTWIMMTHHLVAAILAFSAIYNDMMSYYALFFLGISEVSSIFLVSMDIPSYLASSGGMFYSIVKDASGPLFAITFILYRVIVWWPCSLRLYRDVTQVVTSKKAEELRPGRTW
eukprot:CAMPEP_0178907392 /NCGR_PEP_ID=MMETSP0786-20121207/7346_1 /TAXON_ID=186022 /ORGANISM="Thalassionema frauenfeldii, Strain CCMP 1798" /LENGTH=255 /DNA_ID=CAMNT_0020579187 /DNA_START=49 /DNA_END=813 /DNA_ORIENTATION=-